MDQRNKIVLIAAVAIVAIAVLAVNFNQVTGAAIINADVAVTPSVVAGSQITVLVNSNNQRLRNQIELRKVGGSEVRTCTFDNCDGSWCSKPRFREPGTTLIANCRTSPTWNGGYYAAVKQYQTNKEIGRAYFTVT